MVRFPLLLVLIFIGSESLWGQTCCSGGVPVSSNLGFQSSDKGTLQLSLSADFNVLKTLKSGADRLDDNQRKRTTQSIIIRGAYTLSEKLTLEAFVPIVRQTRSIHTNLGGLDTESTHGLGDPITLLIYNVVQKAITLRIGTGPQIPLGSTNQTNKIGLVLLEDLQPGSGAWDLISLASLEIVPQKRPSALIYLNLIHSSTGVNKDSRSGSQTYEFGNDLQMIGGYSDQIFLGGMIVNPGFSLRFRTAERDRVNVTDLPGSGGQFLFSRISMGLPFPKLSATLTVNVEAPLWARVNETQLSPSYVINTSWTMSFVKAPVFEEYLKIN